MEETDSLQQEGCEFRSEDRLDEPPRRYALHSWESSMAPTKRRPSPTRSPNQREDQSMQLLATSPKEGLGSPVGPIEHTIRLLNHFNPDSFLVTTPNRSSARSSTCLPSPSFSPLPSPYAAALLPLVLTPFLLCHSWHFLSFLAL